MEVRFNSLQMFAIDRALGKFEGGFRVTQEWYALTLSHHAEIARGRSVLVSFPMAAGACPRVHGQPPDCRTEWLPVIIKALQQNEGTMLLAEVLTGLYEAIVWGFAEELNEFDGMFDVATIAGRERILARRAVMERLHGLTEEAKEILTVREGLHHGC